jgi:hypothetical protein
MAALLLKNNLYYQRLIVKSGFRACEWKTYSTDTDTVRHAVTLKWLLIVFVRLIQSQRGVTVS